MRSQINNSFNVGDLIKHVSFIHENKKRTELGIIIALFKNSGNQEFAEILWDSGELTPFDLCSIQKIDDKDDIY
tara:strand:- start:322 stop:543 length:222 start_codon:yes stop_codon:yes gene_type:complete